MPQLAATAPRQRAAQRAITAREGAPTARLAHTSGGRGSFKAGRWVVVVAGRLPSSFLDDHTVTVGGGWCYPQVGRAPTTHTITLK